MLIRDMIRRNCFTTAQIAHAAECSECFIRNIHCIQCLFGSKSPPLNRGGRSQSITPPMLEALCDHHTGKPGFYLEEMALFLYDQFGISASSSSLKRTLSTAGWTKKKAQQKVNEWDPDLRDFYLHKMSEFHSYQLVYVDESGCDKRIGFRTTCWSPLGVALIQVAKFHCGQHYQILSTYAQDSILLSSCFHRLNRCRYL